ncbi:hypothetical protein [Curtobacterium sp. UCD-KPL2560]|uniref:hypothetical protein n=1 Tax=Curtobacterium sp. UCD-KPL2560 TaxID=1885315 RepID=UPI000824FF89|nr:hypothetical protein [Curtobacterium sp. UCD-KPL2560]
MNAGLIVTLIVGVVAPTSAAWATVKVAQIRASKSSPAELQAAATETDRVSLDTFREFRTWAEGRMDWQDRRIAVLEGALAKVSEKYTLIKEAFREFYREVRALLGTGTPLLDEHVRELLTEQDLDDTFGGAALKRLREDAPPPPPPPV